MTCSAFWNYVNIRPGDRVYPCCRFKKSVTNFNGNIEEIIQGPEYQDLRRRSLDGEHIAECQKCYDEEALGLVSLRNELNEKYESKTPQVKFLEIGIDNLCNLVCDGCNSEFSTSWIAKEKLIHGEPLNKKLTTEQVTNVPSSIEKILFLGGEPLITDKHLDILNLHPNPEKCEVVYNTNASYIPSKQCEYIWNSFKKIHFIISIDGIGKVNEQVRGGSKWKDTLDFIDYCYGNEYDFEINTVLHYNNWFDLPNLVKFITPFDKKWYINLLTYPENLALNNQSTENLEKFLDNSRKLDYPNKTYILNYILQEINRRQEKNNEKIYHGQIKRENIT